MEIVSRRPKNGAAALLSDYEDDIIGEIAPGALMHAFYYLPKGLRSRFPMLTRIRTQSEEYESERMLLSPSEVKTLDEEFYYLRRLCRGEEVVYVSRRRFDGDQFMDRWRGHSASDDFEQYLSQIEVLLQRAIQENAYIMLSL
jgi:hypothetical protein